MSLHILKDMILVFFSAQGFMTLLSEIRPINDLGNWLPDNLRAGDWLMDYVVARLLRGSDECRRLGNWFQEIFASLKNIPTFLKPKYFDVVYSKAYMAVLNQAWYVVSINLLND